MRRIWAVSAIMVVFAGTANAQITRTATFDNYPPGQDFIGTFTDSLSGIYFYNSTGQLAPGFDVDSDHANLFNGTNYLTAGAGPNDGFGNLGFNANLPNPSDGVSIEAFYIGDVRQNVVLSAYDSNDTLVGQQAGPVSAPPGAFTLEIRSNEYNITSFQVTVGTGGAAYDNITYTYFPEPHALFTIIPLALFPYRRRR